MRQIEAIIFDKDGTLFDFRQTWTGWAERLFLELAGDRRRAAALGERLGYRFADREFDQDAVIIAGTPDQIAAELAVHYPDLGKDQLYSKINDMAADVEPVSPLPLVPYLEALRQRGLKLAVATNDVLAPTYANLERAGIRQCFDAIFASDSGFTPKPAPDMLLGLAGHIAVAPEACVMVGDSTHDLHAGRAAGMHAIAVLTGMAGAAELAPHADVVLPDIGHIPQWLDRAG